MDGKSLSPQEEKIKQLKTLFPEIVTEGKINWEQLKATLGSDIDTSNERYGLSWAGKSDAFQSLQTPITHTLVPDPDASTNFNTTKNIFIEGENLDVLKVLQRSYFGKVKMIYIDPPYNTGNDAFIYNDHYTENRLQYEKKAGDKDANGHKTHESILRKNTKDKGHYHSNWLNMMYPRLFLAKSLLQDDGVIFVSIDDHEVHNLRLIMNEIFGEENCIGVIVRQTKLTSNKGNFFSPSHEYILAYAKQILKLSQFNDRDYQNSPQYQGKFKFSDKKGAYKTVGLYQASLDSRPNQRYFIKCPDGSFVIPPGNSIPAQVADGAYIKPRNNKDKIWRWSYARYLKCDKKMLVFKKTKKSPLLNEKGKQSVFNVYTKQYLTERLDSGKRPNTILTHYTSRQASDELKNLDIPFSFSKPKKLIKYLANIANINANDLILDFFAGSATTAEAVMELNQEDGGHRRYICVQMAEPCDERSEAFQAGFHTIADIAKERIRRAAKKIKTTHPNYQGDLGCKVFSLEKSNFKQWQQPATRTKDALLTQMEAMITPLASHATDQSILYEILLKEGKSLNSTIAQKGDYYRISDDDTLIVLLHTISSSLIKEIIDEKPQKVIALDQIFQGDDPLKTNTALQMKEADILFETI